MMRQMAPFTDIHEASHNCANAYLHSSMSSNYTDAECHLLYYCADKTLLKY